MSDVEGDQESNSVCLSLRDEFSALMDGELSSEREAAVREHLSHCAACSAHLSSLGEVDDLLLGLQAPAVPGLLLTSIKERIRQEGGLDLDLESNPPLRIDRSSARNGSWTWSVPLAAAAAVLVLLAVVQLGEDPGSGQMVNQESTQAVMDEELLFSVDIETIEEMELLEDLDVLEAMAREQRPDLFPMKATRS